MNFRFEGISLIEKNKEKEKGAMSQEEWERGETIPNSLTFKILLSENYFPFFSCIPRMVLLLLVFARSHSAHNILKI